MSWSYAVLLALLGYVTAQGCEPYKSFPEHTMCIYTEKACPGFRIIRSGELTPAEQQEMIDIHNKLRQSLVQGAVPGQPRAVSMKPMIWDPELATIAQRAADQCSLKNDKMRDVSRFRVGQNIDGSGRKPHDPDTSPNMTMAALDWWGRVVDFNPANISPFVFDENTGSYTQMAWADSYLLGCGYTMYADGEWSWKHYFCNYGPAGNAIGGTMYKVQA